MGRAKNKTQNQAPEALVQLQQKFFARLAEERPQVADNFVIYHDGYRIRMQSAIEEDFPVSSLLMGESFLVEFENFAVSFPSLTYTLNELARYWIEYLKKNLKHESKNQILDLAELEWHLVRSFYRSEHSDDDEHFVILDEDSGSSVIIPSATFLLPFEHNVVTAYENEEWPKKEKTWVVVWTDPNSEDGTNFRALSAVEADILESLEMFEEIEQVIAELKRIGMSEKKIAEELKSFFELGTKLGFLVYQA